MLSAFDIAYEKWVFFTAAALASLYCASLYFAAWWENVGYVLVFIFVLNAGFGLQTYISSGFFTSETASLERLIRTLNKAAYSPEEISTDAFTVAMDMIR